jgi:hypothetical protein
LETSSAERKERNGEDSAWKRVTRLDIGKEKREGRESSGGEW